MPDDKVPEEGQQTYLPLLTALHSAAHQHTPITDAEQIDILARVHDRLADATAAPSTSAAPTVTAPPSRRLLQPSVPALHPVRAPRWSVRLLVALGAMILLFGASWGFFKAAPSSHPPTTSDYQPTAEPAPSAQAQAGGLEASMRVLVAGPYFLSELLPVDLSFTNHAQGAVTFWGLHTTATLCHTSALMVHITAGSNPSFVFQGPGEACLEYAPFTTIQPGATLTIHQYLPLTQSGAVTLTMQSGWDATPSDAIPSALDGHWPSVQIQVNPQVPPNRALTLQSQPGLVTIQVPDGAQAHLLFMQAIECASSAIQYSGNSEWAPLSTNQLHESACPSGRSHWNYLISAPGYSIVSGSQQT